MCYHTKNIAIYTGTFSKLEGYCTVCMYDTCNTMECIWHTSFFSVVITSYHSASQQIIMGPDPLCVSNHNGIRVTKVEASLTEWALNASLLFSGGPFSIVLAFVLLMACMVECGTGKVVRIGVAAQSCMNLS